MDEGVDIALIWAAKLYFIRHLKPPQDASMKFHHLVDVYNHFLILASYNFKTFPSHVQVAKLLKLKKCFSWK
jgi:hypothetical protein